MSYGAPSYGEVSYGAAPATAAPPPPSGFFARYFYDLTGADMFKNVASKITFFVFDTTTGLPKTGDAANLTAYVSKDYGAVTVLADTSATEDDSTNAKGMYTFDVAQTEANADQLKFTCKSSTSNIVCVPQFVATTPNRFSTMVIDAAGLVDSTVVKVGPTGAGTAQTAKDIGGAVPAAAAGASGGLMISGSNAGTTTLGALTVTGATTLTGNVALADGLSIASPSTTNRAGLSVAGNGTGAGMSLTGGATGIGLSVVGGGTSGDGVKVTTTSGHGLNLAPVGTSMHGIFATGGNGGTSDGVKAVAGTGGVPIRGGITGDITGNLSGSAGSVTGAVGSVTGAVGSVTGAVGSVTGNVGGSVGSVVGDTPQTGDSFARIGAAGVGLTAVRLSTTGIADVWAYVIEGTWTAVMYMRLMAAALVAKLSGAATATVTIRDVDDTKNRLVVTVDADGNRSAFGTRDGT